MLNQQTQPQVLMAGGWARGHAGLLYTVGTLSHGAIHIFCHRLRDENQLIAQSHMSAGEAGGHVVGFLDLFIDIFLEVQDKKCS